MGLIEQCSLLTDFGGFVAESYAMAMQSVHLKPTNHWPWQEFEKKKMFFEYFSLSFVILLLFR